MEYFYNIINYFKSISLDDVIHVLISILIFSFFNLFSQLFTYIIVKLFNFKVKEKTLIKHHAFYNPLQIFFSILGIYLALIFLNVPKDLLSISSKAFRISVIILSAVGISNSINPNSEILTKLKIRFNFSKDSTIVSFISAIAKFLIYILAGVIIISELGYDINGLVAGLGLGGLTIALAAQDIAKNFFGGIVILTDKPFTVGDWIQTNTIEGVIEDITFRSTRIRTFSDSIVTIPNSVLSNEAITNGSKMTKRRVKVDLLFSLDTPIEKLKICTEKIEAMLMNLDSCIEETIYVRFNDIKSSGNNIFISFFTTYTDYREYLAIKEEVNYNILSILLEEKVTLVYPTQTIYVKK
jgi:MscS family membrane protein